MFYRLRYLSISLVNVEKDVEKMDQYFVDVQFFFFFLFGSKDA